MVGTEKDCPTLDEAHRQLTNIELQDIEEHTLNLAFSSCSDDQLMPKVQ